MANIIRGTNDEDEIEGTDVADLIYGRGEDDEIDGEGGDDEIYGGGGDDDIEGDDGNDTIYGDSGNDDLEGDDGNDVLFGGKGRDTLDGGEGDDILTGGAGRDVFVFDDDESGTDTVTDFEHGRDKLDFDDLDDVDSFAEAMALAVQVGNNVEFRIDEDTTVVVENTTLDAFTAKDFIFD